MHNPANILKKHGIVTFKWVSCMECEWHFNKVIIKIQTNKNKKSLEKFLLFRSCLLEVVSARLSRGLRKADVNGSWNHCHLSISLYQVLHQDQRANLLSPETIEQNCQPESIGKKKKKKTGNSLRCVYAHTCAVCRPHSSPWRSSPVIRITGEGHMFFCSWFVSNLARPTEIVCHLL